MEAHLGMLWDLGVKEPHQLATLGWEDVEDTGMKKFEVGWEQPYTQPRHSLPLFRSSHPVGSPLSPLRSHLNLMPPHDPRQPPLP